MRLRRISNKKKDNKLIVLYVCKVESDIVFEAQQVSKCRTSVVLCLDFISATSKINNVANAYQKRGFFTSPLISFLYGV